MPILIPVQSGETTLNAADDTYVSSASPNSNYGGQSYMEISHWSLSEEKVWLKFDMSPIPSNAVIDKATLQLYATSVGETFNIHAYLCTNNGWNELTLTYNNMPTYSTTLLDSVAVASSSKTYSWNVIDAATGAMNNSPKSVSIMLTDPSTHNIASVSFYSKEALFLVLDNSPHLIVHWTINPSGAPSSTPIYSSPTPSTPSSIQFDVTVGDKTYQVIANSNSTVSVLTFNSATKELNFKVNGESGTAGFCRIGIPTALVWGELSLYKDRILLVKNVDYTQSNDGTNNILQINYNHSTHNFKIVGTEAIPEFPTFIAVPILMATILIGIAIYRKKLLNSLRRHFESWDLNWD